MNKSLEQSKCAGHDERIFIKNVNNFDGLPVTMLAIYYLGNNTYIVMLFVYLIITFHQIYTLDNQESSALNESRPNKRHSDYSLVQMIRFIAFGSLSSIK